VLLLLLLDARADSSSQTTGNCASLISCPGVGWCRCATCCTWRRVDNTSRAAGRPGSENPVVPAAPKVSRTCRQVQHAGHRHARHDEMRCGNKRTATINESQLTSTRPTPPRLLVTHIDVALLNPHPHPTAKPMYPLQYCYVSSTMSPTCAPAIRAACWPTIWRPSGATIRRPIRPCWAAKRLPQLAALHLAAHSVPPEAQQLTATAHSICSLKTITVSPTCGPAIRASCWPTIWRPSGATIR
jgi:hypothetical protein